MATLGAVTQRLLPVLGGTDTFAVGRILALGGNSNAHVSEMDGDPEAPPAIFLKPPSALVADGGTVVRPPYSLQLHHEVELVAAIGEGGRQLTAEAAAACIFGYAVGLDMTLRDVQADAKRRGRPWAVAKGFDTSAPVSTIVPANCVPDPDSLLVRLAVNAEPRQSGRAGALTLPPAAAVAFVSQALALEPGDLIFTGSPPGVGEVHPGDTLKAELVGHTTLSVTVRSAASPLPPVV